LVYVQLNSDGGSDKYWGRTVQSKNTLYRNFVMQTKNECHALLGGVTNSKIGSLMYCGILAYS